MRYKKCCTSLGFVRPTECHPSGINVTLRFASGDIDSRGVTFGGSHETQGGATLFILHLQPFISITNKTTRMKTLFQVYKSLSIDTQTKTIFTIVCLHI